MVIIRNSSIGFLAAAFVTLISIGLERASFAGGVQDKPSIETDVRRDAKDDQRALGRFGDRGEQGPSLRSIQDAEAMRRLQTDNPDSPVLKLDADLGYLMDGVTAGRLAAQMERDGTLTPDRVTTLRTLRGRLAVAKIDKDRMNTILKTFIKLGSEGLSLSEFNGHVSNFALNLRMYVENGVIDDACVLQLRAASFLELGQATSREAYLYSLMTMIGRDSSDHTRVTMEEIYRMVANNPSILDEAEEHLKMLEADCL